jgi:transcriptional regulator with XRE-family HTH domain
MMSLRNILASNIKENRRKCGFSQAKLAEVAGISPQHIAMVEISRKFPTPEMLDKIAGALNIETYELFSVKPSPEAALDRLRREIITEIKQTVGESVAEAIEKGFADNCKK